MTVLDPKLARINTAFSASRVFDQIVMAMAQSTVGDRSPVSVAWIRSRFGVGRAMALETMARLRRCGLIQRSGRSTVLAMPSAARLREIGEIHKILIGLAARLAATRITDADMTELADSLARQKALLEGNDPAPALVMAENDRFHGIIARASGNATLAEDLQSDLHRSFIVFHRQQVVWRPAALRRTYVEHCRIVDAIDDRDPDLAEFMARRHDSSAWQAQDRDVSETPATLRGMN